jgi:gentisate 1,2-dioxygenase
MFSEVLEYAGSPRIGQASAAAPTDAERLNADLENDALKGLWLVQGRTEIASRVKPHVWKAEVLRTYLQRAGALTTLEDSAVRRALVLWNPGARDHWDCTNTLTAAVQMMLPGESVITHRHMHSAMRFITQGKGATTTVNGEKITLCEGDLVLTPNWAWHDHANESDGPIVWMDGLDRPLLKLLDSIFFEVYPTRGYQPVTRTNDATADRYGTGALRPYSEQQRPVFSPQLAYRWNETYAALRQMEKVGDASPYDDVIAEYRNPATGGHVTPTIGCAIQLLRPGIHTQAHRHTSSAVYHVYRGRGHSVIDGSEYHWSEGDYFALPPRVMHEHANASPSEPAILFSLTDVPVFESLALYREEPCRESGGRQKPA